MPTQIFVSFFVCNPFVQHEMLLTCLSAVFCLHPRSRHPDIPPTDRGPHPSTCAHASPDLVGPRQVVLVLITSGWSRDLLLVGRGNKGGEGLPCSRQCDLVGVNNINHCTGKLPGSILSNSTVMTIIRSRTAQDRKTKPNLHCIVGILVL